MRDVPNPGHFSYQLLWIQAVGSVGRVGVQCLAGKEHQAGTPSGGVAEGAAFGFPQVHEGHNVSGFFGHGPTVGHPNLQPGNLHRTVDDRQGGQRIFVLIAEIMTQKEVPIGLVLIRFNFKLLRCCTPLNVDALALAALLGKQGGYRGFAKLELAFHPKQRLRTGDQAGGHGQTNVSQFQRLNNVVFLSAKIQLRFILKSKRRLRIVVHLQIQTIAHFARGVYLHALIKIQGPRALIAQRNHGVLYFLVPHPKPQFSGSLGPNLHGIAAEDVFECLVGHKHVRNQAGTLPTFAAGSTALGQSILPRLRLLQIEHAFAVLRRGEKLRNSQRDVAHEPLYLVQSGGRVKGRFCTKSVGLNLAGIVPWVGPAAAVCLCPSPNRKQHNRQKRCPQTHQSYRQLHHSATNAVLIHASTPASGCAATAAATAFSTATREKPSTSRAAMASALPLPGPSAVPPTPVAPDHRLILSRRSTTKRWALFVPIPLTAWRRPELPEAMVSTTSAGVMEESIMRAVPDPMPETLSKSKNTSRSSGVEKPYKI